MKVLIIEDEEILLRVLEEKFKRANFEIVVASDGDKAMEMVKSSVPDVIVLDLILPRKNGFEVLRELKTDLAFKNIPVVVLSNLGQEEDMKRALQLGAEDYLVKTQHPINEVVEKVRSWVLNKK